MLAVQSSKRAQMSHHTIHGVAQVQVPLDLIWSPLSYVEAGRSCRLFLDQINWIMWRDKYVETMMGVHGRAGGGVDTPFAWMASWQPFPCPTVVFCLLFVSHGHVLSLFIFLSAMGSLSLFLFLLFGPVGCVHCVCERGWRKLESRWRECDASGGWVGGWLCKLRLYTNMQTNKDARGWATVTVEWVQFEMSPECARESRGSNAVQRFSVLGSFVCLLCQHYSVIHDQFGGSQVVQSWLHSTGYLMALPLHFVCLWGTCFLNLTAY